MSARAGWCGRRSSGRAETGRRLRGSWTSRERISTTSLTSTTSRSGASDEQTPRPWTRNGHRSRAARRYAAPVAGDHSPWQCLLAPPRHFLERHSALNLHGAPGGRSAGPWQCLFAPPRHLPDRQSLLNMHGLPSGRSPAAAGRAGMARQTAAKVSATTSVLMDTPPSRPRPSQVVIYIVGLKSRELTPRPPECPAPGWSASCGRLGRMNLCRCDGGADSRAGASELLQDAGHLEREAGDARLEDAAALGVHLVGAFHGAEGRRE